MSSRKKWIVASAIAVLALASVSVFILLDQQPSKVYFSMNAVIADQLAEDFPNLIFMQNVTTLLTNYGFTVSYHNDTDVEFFRGLAKSDYGVIVLRAHMGLRVDNSSVDLFTSEPYDDTKYKADQDAGLLVKGTLNYSGNQKEYFAISPEFIGGLQGSFPRSLVIATGCWSLKPGLTKTAAEFVRKGSDAYVGWSDLVGNVFSDTETIKLIQRLIENRTIDQSVGYAITDPIFGGSMHYYPESAGNIRLSDLVEESDQSESSALRLFGTYSDSMKARDADSFFGGALLPPRSRLI